MTQDVDYRSKLYPYELPCPECGEDGIVFFRAGELETKFRCKMACCDCHDKVTVTRPRSDLHP